MIVAALARGWAGSAQPVASGCIRFAWFVLSGDAVLLPRAELHHEPPDPDPRAAEYEARLGPVWPSPVEPAEVYGRATGLASRRPRRAWRSCGAPALARIRYDTDGSARARRTTAIHSPAMRTA